MVDNEPEKSSNYNCIIRCGIPFACPGRFEITGIDFCEVSAALYHCKGGSIVFQEKSEGRNKKFKKKGGQ